MFLLPTRCALCAFAASLAIAVAGGCAHVDAQPDAAQAMPATPVGTAQDFDFEHGHWHTTLRRRLQPLSGSDVWAEYTGTTIVRPALGGRANLVELDVSGPAGR